MTEVLHLSQVFKLFTFFFYIVSKLTMTIFKNADVGPQRPANLRPFERRVPIVQAPAPQDAAAETLIELEQDPERLTMDIPETTIDDIPIRLQCYVVAVPGPFRRFLCRVARAMVSYRTSPEEEGGGSKSTPPPPTPPRPSPPPEPPAPLPSRA